MLALFQLRSFAKRSTPRPATTSAAYWSATTPAATRSPRDQRHL